MHASPSVGRSLDCVSRQAIYENFGVEENPHLASAWRDNFVSDRSEQERYLSQEAVDTENRVPVHENSDKTKEILALMKKELQASHLRSDTADDEVDLAMSPEMIALMERTLQALEEFTNLDPGAIEPWYIPREDVRFDPRLSLPGGAFTDAYPGACLVDGVWCEDAAVKILGDVSFDDEVLSSELRTLWSLHHPHIVELYGANHIAKQKFLVFKLDEGGDWTTLPTYFEDESHRELLWDKFHQAADGLAFLHANGAAHGGIQGRNVLVTDDGTVKLGDLKLSVHNDRSGFMSHLRNSDEIRWKAPEALNTSDAGLDRAAEDVYSLGLCIVEAVTKELPFADMSEDKIFEVKMENEQFVRPDGFRDDEWDFVASMLDNNPAARPTAAKLVELMSNWDMATRPSPDDAGRALSKVSQEGRCAVCGRQNPRTYSFCGNCGYLLLESAAVTP